jgi:hypothetical protein
MIFVHLNNNNNNNKIYKFKLLCIEILVILMFLLRGFSITFILKLI